MPSSICPSLQRSTLAPPARTAGCARQSDVAADTHQWWTRGRGNRTHNLRSGCTAVAAAIEEERACQIMIWCESSAVGFDERAHMRDDASCEGSITGAAAPSIGVNVPCPTQLARGYQVGPDVCRPAGSRNCHWRKRLSARALRLAQAAP